MRPLTLIREFAATVLFAALPSRCEHHLGAARALSHADSRGTPTKADGDGPTRMEELAGTSPPIYVMRGAHHGSAPIVVLHGMCSHALGYAQSFQWNAAKKGLVVAPQGDRPCAGPWASWTMDLKALDERIRFAFAALGLPEPLRDVTVVGYSQGASRAEALARRWPERYSRLVLIASPDAPSARGLSNLRAAVMMAGERDRRDLMNRGVAAFRAAHVPVTFQVIPGARHGEMGPHPEETMGAALDWLWTHDGTPDGG